MSYHGIPQSTKAVVISAMEDGASAREAAKKVGIDIGTAIRYWRSTYGSLRWPAQHQLAAPLRLMDAAIKHVVVVDYECPHCGAVIHHAAIDTNRPFFCSWCGKEVA